MHLQPRTNGARTHVPAMLHCCASPIELCAPFLRNRDSKFLSERVKKSALWLCKPYLHYFDLIRLGKSYQPSQNLEYLTNYTRRFHGINQITLHMRVMYKRIYAYRTKNWCLWYSMNMGLYIFAGMFTIIFLLLFIVICK